MKYTCTLVGANIYLASADSRFWSTFAMLLWWPNALFRWFFRNFHCWNEVWMKRPDLNGGQGYDGWQVCNLRNIWNIKKHQLRNIKTKKLRVGCKKYVSRFQFYRISACISFMVKKVKTRIPLTFLPNILYDSTTFIGRFLEKLPIMSSLGHDLAT